MVLPEVPSQPDLRAPVNSLLSALPVPTRAVVVGPPGSGKTVLAVHLARAAAASVPVDLVVASSHLVRLLRKEFAGNRSIHVNTWRGWLNDTFRQLLGRTVPMQPGGSATTIDWHGVSAAMAVAVVRERQAIIDESQDVPSRLIEFVAQTSSSVIAFADPYQRFALDGSAPDDLVRAIGANDPWPVFVLEEDFRTTKQIQAFATRAWAPDRPALTRPSRRDGPQPVVYRGDLGRIRSEALRLLDASGGTVVIAAAQVDRASIIVDLEGAGIDIARANTAHGRLRVMAFEALRGLEFDSVIVVPPIETHEPWSALAAHLYVSCTRARRQLSVVVRPGTLPEVERGIVCAAGAFEGGLS